jgi:ferredoxin
MAYKISEDCISCGACETECPNEAITEGETIYVIAADKCTECVGSFDSSRCADVCPVDACIQDEDREESQDVLMERWKKLHPGETPA